LCAGVPIVEIFIIRFHYHYDLFALVLGLHPHLVFRLLVRIQAFRLAHATRSEHYHRHLRHRYVSCRHLFCSLISLIVTIGPLFHRPKLMMVDSVNVLLYHFQSDAFSTDNGDWPHTGVTSDVSISERSIINLPFANLFRFGYLHRRVN
jgi:hypothetical protein